MPWPVVCTLFSLSFSSFCLQGGFQPQGHGRGDVQELSGTLLSQALPAGDGDTSRWWWLLKAGRHEDAGKALAARARRRDLLLAQLSSMLPGSKQPWDTDQLIFLCSTLPFDKHLTRIKISPSPSLFRDICLLQHCRHRHIFNVFCSN